MRCVAIQGAISILIQNTHLYLRLNLVGLCILLSLSWGCTPGIPQDIPPKFHLGATKTFIERGPVGIAVASNATVQVDSRGWQYWQSDIQTTQDTLFWPLRMTMNTLLSPLAVPLSSHAAANHEKYLEQVTLEMGLLKRLKSEVLISLNKSPGPTTAFSSDHKGHCTEDLSTDQSGGCPPLIHNVLILYSANIFWDNVTVYKKSNKNLPDFNLILQTNWAIKSLNGEFPSIKFEEVSEHPYVGGREELPYNLILALKEHSSEIAEKLNNL